MPGVLLPRGCSPASGLMGGGGKKMQGSCDLFQNGKLCRARASWPTVEPRCQEARGIDLEL